jgi:hypothetical protein
MTYEIHSRDSNTFSISLKKLYYNQELYESIIKSCNNASSSFLFIDNNELVFQANKVCNLHQFIQKQKQNVLNYEQCMYIIYFLSRQIHFLEIKGISILGFDLQDIMVVDEHIFFITTNHYLLEINNHNHNHNHNINSRNNYMSLLVPFNKPYFSSPELIELTNLPAFIHCKSFYYSLAALIIYCLFDEYIFKGNEIKNDDEINIILQPIFSSKMYWFLKRCLYSDWEKRCLLFI